MTKKEKEAKQKEEYARIIKERDENLIVWKKQLNDQKVIWFTFPSF